MMNVDTDRRWRNLTGVGIGATVYRLCWKTAMLIKHYVEITGSYSDEDSGHQRSTTSDVFLIKVSLQVSTTAGIQLHWGYGPFRDWEVRSWYLKVHWVIRVLTTEVPVVNEGWESMLLWPKCYFKCYSNSNLGTHHEDPNLFLLVIRQDGIPSAAPFDNIMFYCESSLLNFMQTLPKKCHRKKKSMNLKEFGEKMKQKPTPTDS